MRPNLRLVRHSFRYLMATALLVAACSQADTNAATFSPTSAPGSDAAAPSTTSSTHAVTGVDSAPSTAPTSWAPTTTPCAAAGTWAVCEVADYRQRPYDLYLPTSYEIAEPIPVVVALHGGGGRAESAITTTCTDGDRDSPSCLHNIAEREGFAVVYPNGSGFGLLPNLKTWNAGGGTDGYNCTSCEACEGGIDDIQYLGAVLDDLESWMHVDTARVYFTGLSNGAAMSHRAACEMSDRIAAIAAVGGTNQYAATVNCDLIFAPSIMQIHGTEDPCWTYETSDAACVDTSGGLKLGVEESTAGWVERFNCSMEPVTTELPDSSDDGTRTTRTVWSGCADGAAEVHLLTITGGGHTWPSGEPYLPERRVGRVTTDWDSTLIWEFFSTIRHPVAGR
jgi:polyhydroxybutyrate depolymerase